MGELLRIVNLVGEPAPGANTDILGSDVTAARQIATLRLSCAFENRTVFKVMLKDGSSTFGLPLNSNVPLEPESLYTFSFSASSDYDYNFQIETDGAVRVLMVEEVTGGVI